MQCPKCESRLSIGVTNISFDGDDSPETPTMAYNNLPMICTNPKCDMYGGKDLSNPKIIVETLKQKIN